MGSNTGVSDVLVHVLVSDRVTCLHTDVGGRSNINVKEWWGSDSGTSESSTVIPG